jgi:hypothetical protein
VRPKREETCNESILLTKEKKEKRWEFVVMCKGINMLLIDTVHRITEASLCNVISSQQETLHVQNSYKECFYRMEHSCQVEMSESVMRFVVSTYLNFHSSVM